MGIVNDIAKLNPKSQDIKIMVSGGTVVITPEVVAYACATAGPIAGGILRVKWALQDQYIPDLRYSVAEHLQTLAKRGKWERDNSQFLFSMATLILRRAEIIRPDWRGSRVWTPSHALYYFDGPASGIDINQDKHKQRWASIANNYMRMGKPDGECIRIANRVLKGGNRTGKIARAPLKYKAGPELCPACKGAAERKRKDRIITCPKCNGSMAKRWGFAECGRLLGIDRWEYSRTWEKRVTDEIEKLQVFETVALSNASKRLG